MKTRTRSSSNILDTADSALLSRIYCAIQFCGSYLPSSPVPAPKGGISLAGICCAESGAACTKSTALNPKNTFLTARNFESITLQYVSVIRMSKGTTQLRDIGHLCCRGRASYPNCV